MPCLTLSGSNNSCLERISMVPNMFEPLRLDCIWYEKRRDCVYIFRYFKYYYCGSFCCCCCYNYFYYYCFCYCCITTSIVAATAITTTAVTTTASAAATAASYSSTSCCYLWQEEFFPARVQRKQGNKMTAQFVQYFFQVFIHLFCTPFHWG